MKPLTVDRLTARMNDDDWASLRGAVHCALYNVGDAPDSELDRAALTEVLRRLPEMLRESAFQWGFADSAVGDSTIDFLQGRLEDLGSLDAFLGSAAVHS
jgi:hypothetical protein